MLYCWLATSLRSLAIILPIHQLLRSLGSTFAPVWYNSHTYAYEAERRCTCHYTIIAFSINGYVSLMGFREFTRLPMRHLMKSTIETAAFKTRYQSMITARTDLDHFINQLSNVMVSRISSETNLHMRRVTGGKDDNCHEYKPRLFDPANVRNRIRFDIFEFEQHSYKSIERDPQLENLQSMVRSYAE